jgi:hypothetical protein
MAKSTYHFPLFHRVGFIRANLNMKSRSCRDHECLLLHLNLYGILGNAVDGRCIFVFLWVVDVMLSIRKKKCCVLHIFTKSLTFPWSFFNICWKNARHWSLLVFELDLSVAVCRSKTCSILYYLLTIVMSEFLGAVIGIHLHHTRTRFIYF